MDKVVGIKLGIDGKFEEVDVSSLEKMQAIVGGYIEPVPIKMGKGILMYCNGEGKNEGLKPNFLASLIAHAFGLGENDILLGDVFLSSVDGEGETESLNEEQLAYIKKMIYEVYRVISRK